MLRVKLLFTDLLGKRVGHRVMRVLLLLGIVGLKSDHAILAAARLAICKLSARGKSLTTNTVYLCD